MKKIRVLPISVANKIAAGEVVERPASVIKELVENSIDAGAKSISVEIKDGGLTYMRVADNGTGMSKEDAKTCFLRHATSKINEAEDLSRISTLGFRGEAMASIAAVARVNLKTHPHSEDFGTQITIEGGVTKDVSPCGCPDGTITVVEDLFYNVPARRKFLKAARTEAAYVSDYILRIILARPDISIRFINNGNTVYHSSGDGNLKNAIYSVYGAELLPYLRPVMYSDEYLQIQGYVGSEHITKPNRTFQSFFVNGRYIRSQKLSAALLSAYDTRIMSGRFPVAVLEISIDYKEVDVNVHPNKLEVRFADEGRVSSCLHRAAKEALGETSVPSFAFNCAEAKNPEETHKATPKDEEELFRLLMDKSNVSDDISRDLQENSNGDNGKEDEEKHSPVSRLQAEAVLPVYDAHSVTENKEEEHTETMLTQIKFDASPFTVVGNVFDSFWLICQSENLFIMDQHAAHERMIYEKLSKGELKAEKQMLLVPFIVKLTNEEYNTYTDNKELLYEFGFETEDFGMLTLRITAVPLIFKKTEDDSFFRDALSALSKQRNVTLSDLKRDALIQASCKAAVKLGNTVPREMIESLLREYNEKGATLTCPHGRPVMVAITKNDLFKKFKRIL